MVIYYIKDNYAQSQKISQDHPLRFFDWERQINNGI